MRAATDATALGRPRPMRPRLAERVGELLLDGCDRADFLDRVIEASGRFDQVLANGVDLACVLAHAGALGLEQYQRGVERDRLGAARGGLRAQLLHALGERHGCRRRRDGARRAHARSGWRRRERGSFVIEVVDRESLEAIGDGRIERLVGGQHALAVEREGQKATALGRELPPLLDLQLLRVASNGHDICLTQETRRGRVFSAGDA